MQTTIINSIQKRIVVGVMAVTMLFGMIVPMAQAQTVNEGELRLVIANLMAQVAQLQAQLAKVQAVQTQPVRTIPIVGIGTKIATTDSLSVRSGPSTLSPLVSIVARGMIGQVVEGPHSQGGYTWWFVQYDNGTRGWSAGNWLKSYGYEIEQPSVNQQQPSESNENVNKENEHYSAVTAQLQERLLILQRKQLENTYQENTNIIHGNSYVETTSRVTLYEEPGESRVVNKELRGSDGEVSNGPRLIDGVVWWKVNFEEGDEGWVEEKYLERIPSVIISQDQDGDGIKETKVRIIGDYDPDRFILFPYDGGVQPLYIPKENKMLGSWGDEYVSGQSEEIVIGTPAVVQSNPYIKADPFIKGISKSVPIAWTAVGIPENAVVEVLVEAVRLIDNPHSGGVWAGEILAGNSVSLYFWNIEGEGRIGAGDYRSQVSARECGHERCGVIAKSPYRYFSIRNQE